MLVSGGYPEAYEKEKLISGLDTIRNSIVFHAGTKIKDKTVVTNGGRVIAVTSLADDIQEALNKSYKSIESIHFEKMNYRKDIGFDVVE
jgi:phosphoribosylamine--glycine ligase